jgi:transposase-like protein
MTRTFDREFKLSAIRMASEAGITAVEVEQRLGIRNLRRELARVSQERDILKKAAAFFAKESM